MSQRVHPWDRWQPSVGLAPSQTGEGVANVTLDVPPVISSLPTPSFIGGIPGVYDMKQHVTDDDESVVTYAMSGPLPIGYSFDTVTGILTYGGTGSIIDIEQVGVLRSTFDVTCYAGIRFASSGILYINASSSSQVFSTAVEDWLEFGSATNVWVERSPSGPLNWFDAGPGRVNCSTAPTYGILQASLGNSTAFVTFDFYDQAVGGVLLYSRLMTLSATYDSVGGP